MWLLNTSRAELKHFADPSQVRYAILSHLWRENELSFHEVQSLRAQHASPENPRDCVSEKIRRCCIYAEEHGYEWIWIDTCCIDKSSSAEHSEAINSMFVWYALAEVCYAFLDDVGDQEPFDTSFLLPPTPSDITTSNQKLHGSSDFSPQGHIARSDALTIGSELGLQFLATSGPAADAPPNTLVFRESEWFTRGWTLQELIAPRYVVFLSQNWRALGTKDSLVELLQDITGIDGSVLLGEPGSLDKVSIARRMSWAAGRKTTRVEDRTYSLMGLFGIHMPTIYGEGANAFMRLQLEIIKQCPDQSIFAWGPIHYSLTHALGRVGLNCPPELFTLMGARHPYDDEEMHGLLASSPDAFASSANIIPWDATLFMRAWRCVRPLEFRPTSHGMRTNLPLIFARDDEHHTIIGSVLACTDTSDFSFPIVLFLRRYSPSGPGANFYRVGEVVRDFEISIEDTPGQWVQKQRYYRGARLLKEAVRLFCDRAVSNTSYIHIHYPSASRSTRPWQVRGPASDPADHVIFFPHWTIARIGKQGFVPDRACGQDGLSLPLEHGCGKDVFTTITFSNEADHSSFSLVFVAAHKYPAARVEGPWLLVFFDWTPDSAAVVASLRCLPRYCAECLSVLASADSPNSSESPAHEFTIPKPLDEMSGATFGDAQKQITITRKPNWGGFSPFAASRGEVVVLDLELTGNSDIR